MRQNTRILFILISSMNLRLAVTAVTPLFAVIQVSRHLSSGTTALLVTIPLLCFALGAIVAPKLIQTVGSWRLLFWVNVTLVVANLVRPFTTTSLLLGTILIGLAIALLNILIPTLIVENTTNASRLTSYYSVIMNIVAASGTVIAIPLATIWGWPAVLSSFALPAVIAVLVGFKSAAAPVIASHQPTHQNLLTTLKHDRPVRLLALFMGLQSLIFYSLLAWLPAIFQSLGASAAMAGNLLAVFQFVGVPAALALNVLTNRHHTLLLLLSGYLGGMLGLLGGSIGWWLSAILLGFTCSLVFTTALTMIATSSHTPSTVANRSAIAQSLGYLLAAGGPLIFGHLHDLFENWQVTCWLITFLMVITVLVGLRIPSKN